MLSLDDVLPALDARVARLYSEIDSLLAECRGKMRGMHPDDDHNEGDVPPLLGPSFPYGIDDSPPHSPCSVLSLRREARRKF